jgi:type I restriction enzyme M protein
MIDASRGFAKDGNKNRLREQDIRKIVDVFNGRIPLPRYSRVVPVVDIEANDYNLNIPRYIDASEPEDVHDLDGHLRGGIPASDVDDLSRYWTVFPSLRAQLFEPGDRPGYFRARVAVDQVKSTTLANSEYRAYASRVHALYEAWRAAHEPDLFSINASSTSKELVRQLSEDLLVRFAETPLLDRYDVYQSLMGYWDATMQDDVFLVIAGGWVSAAKPRVIVEDKEKKLKEVPDLIVGHTRYKMDLLPPSLLIARFFAGPVDSYAALESRRIDADSALEEFTQEHSGEDGLLEDVINDKGNVTKTAVQARLKEVAEDPDSGEERMVLGRCLELINAQARAEQALKAAHTKILARYATLSEDEIRTIAVTDKWLAAIEAGITGELERLIQNLVDRVTELERRYARTLPDLERDAQDRAVRVRDQLIQMGFVSA